MCPHLQVIFSACELGVFDLLLKTQEPLTAQHVARELSTSVDGMERLLDALVGIEILEVETADGTGEEKEEERVRVRRDPLSSRFIFSHLAFNGSLSLINQLCTAAPMCPTCTWREEVPSLSMK